MEKEIVMDNIFWWIGVVTTFCLASVSAVFALWLAAEAVVKWTGTLSIIMQWYADKLRNKNKSTPAG